MTAELIGKKAIEHHSQDTANEASTEGEEAAADDAPPAKSSNENLWTST